MKNRYDPISYWGLGIVLFFSVLFISYTLGWAFVVGSSDYWQGQNPEFNQHLSGINLYLSSSWQFPLLRFDSLNYPEGSSVTFVDGIPILAFLLKIFLPCHIGFINPLGYWVALNVLLQGVAAWWITKELKVKSWVFLAFLVITLLTYPAWMDRLRQVALMSHWLILFAIALYIRGCRQQCLPKWGWSALIFCSFYIHIYLFAMVLGIYFAAVFDSKKQFTVQYCISIFLPLFILGGSLFLFLLPLPPHVGIGGSLGYEMNLLAPFHGGKLIQLQSQMSHSLKGVNYNYLGLGVIVIFLWTIFSQHTKNCETVKRHAAFFIILCGFFIYSLSNKIYFGDHLVAVVSYSSLLKPITGQFRAAERFFWPVGYAIVIFSLYRFYIQLKPGRFAIIVLLLLIIQYVDVSDFYYKFKRDSHKLPEPVLDYVALDHALDKHIKYIYLYPKFKCSHGKSRLPYPGVVVIPMMRYVAERHLKLNTGYIARNDSNCNDTIEEIAQSEKASSAYIFSKIDYKNMNQVYDVFRKKNNLSCYNLDTVYVCHFQIKN